MQPSAGRGGYGNAVAWGAVVVLAASAVLGGATVGAAGDGSTPAPPEWSAGSLAPVENFSEVRVYVDVAKNGSAEWVFEYRFQLDDPKTEAAYERAKRSVSEPPVGFRQRVKENAVRTAEERTGRSMRVMAVTANVGKSTTTGRVGYVRYTLLWTNFVDRSQGDRVVVGDAIGGMVFEGNETLTIRWPESFERVDVTPSPDADGDAWARWEGPFEFSYGQPRVELDPPAGGLPLVPIVAAGVLAVGIAGWYGRSRWLGTGDGEAVPGPDGASAGASEAGGDETDADPDRARADATGSGHVEDGPDPAEELLTDEERVLQLLERNGGRMKQQDLIAAVDWSRTKTSEVVNEMHEAEQIELYQLGRENVLALPGEIDV